MKSTLGDVYYFDSSVILRHAINHESALPNLSLYSKRPFTSALTHVECLRVLDSWRLTKEIADEKLIATRSICLKMLDGLNTWRLTITL